LQLLFFLFSISLIKAFAIASAFFLDCAIIVTVADIPDLKALGFLKGFVRISCALMLFKSFDS
jgi:hypothetical protein